MEIFIDLLRTDKPVEPEIQRKQKACDTESLSQYNKLAKTGGHKSKYPRLISINFHNIC